MAKTVKQWTNKLGRVTKIVELSTGTQVKIFIGTTRSKVTASTVLTAAERVECAKYSWTKPIRYTYTKDTKDMTQQTVSNQGTKAAGTGLSTSTLIHFNNRMQAVANVLDKRQARGATHIELISWLAGLETSQTPGLARLEQERILEFIKAIYADYKAKAEGTSVPQDIKVGQQVTITVKGNEFTGEVKSAQRFYDYSLPKIDGRPQVNCWYIEMVDADGYGYYWRQDMDGGTVELS